MRELSYQPPALNTFRNQANWWLRLASHKFDTNGLDLDYSSVPEIERSQRNRLTAWILLGFFVALLVLFPFSVGSVPLLAFLGILTTILSALTILNHLGFTTMVGIVLITIISAVILVRLITNPGGIDVVDLPSYDMLTLTLILAASVLPLPATLFTAGANISLIIGDFLLQAKSPDMLQQFASAGSIALLSRPIALNILIAGALYIFVRSQKHASTKQHVAMTIASERTQLATAMHQDVEEMMLIQQYQARYLEAIATYVADRLRGLTSTITLDFPPPKNQLEQHTQSRIIAEATRLNHLFSRLDRSEEQRNWDVMRFLMTLRHYNHLLSRCLVGGDLNQLHPKQFNTTGDLTLDATVALVFANIVGAAPWQTLANSQLNVTDVAHYADSVRQNALLTYQQSTQMSPVNEVVPPSLPSISLSEDAVLTLFSENVELHGDIPRPDEIHEIYGIHESHHPEKAPFQVSIQPQQIGETESGSTTPIDFSTQTTLPLTHRAGNTQGHTQENNQENTQGDFSNQPPSWKFLPNQPQPETPY